MIAGTTPRLKAAVDIVEPSPDPDDGSLEIRDSLLDLTHALGQVSLASNRWTLRVDTELRDAARSGGAISARLVLVELHRPKRPPVFNAIRRRKIALAILPFRLLPCTIFADPYDIILEIGAVLNELRGDRISFRTEPGSISIHPDPGR